MNASSSASSSSAAAAEFELGRIDATPIGSTQADNQEESDMNSSPTDGARGDQEKERGGDVRKEEDESGDEDENEDEEEDGFPVSIEEESTISGFTSQLDGIGREDGIMGEATSIQGDTNCRRRIRSK